MIGACRLRFITYWMNVGRNTRYSAPMAVQTRLPSAFPMMSSCRRFPLWGPKGFPGVRMIICSLPPAGRRPLFRKGKERPPAFPALEEALVEIDPGPGHLLLDEGEGLLIDEGGGVEAHRALLRHVGDLLEEPVRRRLPLAHPPQRLDLSHQSLAPLAREGRGAGR